MNNHNAPVRLAATADIHCTKKTQDSVRNLLSAMAESADIILIGGDLCDSGSPEEAQILARELASLKIPVVAVLGNHDFESGKAGEVEAILSDAGINMLDGQCCEIRGIGFAGAKGFAGGFGDKALQPWGEQIIKNFVREAVDEALKLESAIAGLRTDKRIALLHYSPILETCMGESPLLQPFLGSSRLEEPLNRYPVTAIFHGHAHHGTPEGKTKAGVPVYNVAKPLLENLLPGVPPFKIITIEPEEKRIDIEAIPH
jgi:Icc-related predicted phosphoesterase